jgi:pimeloyl-ACP methyl ester carboxylesterase
MRSPAGGARTDERYLHAYDKVLSKWPEEVEVRDIAGRFGSTRVNVCGRRDGRALVLLHGGGATSTVWFANISALSLDHRIYAIDTLGDAGRSAADGADLRRPEQLMEWLEGVLDGLGLEAVDLVGHSYGGWIALSFTIHAPHRIRSLALLDPTGCFAGFSPRYLAHAVPALLRPSAVRMGSLLRWETANAELDPDWFDLFCLGAEFVKAPVVTGPKPSADQVGKLDMPTLVVLAGRSRVHDVRVVERNVRKRMPQASIFLLPRASHHGMPMREADVLNQELLNLIG